VAVDHFSLAVEPGEFVTLLGPSGCGKTTTLRMVAGLERNTGGRILIGDMVASDPAAQIFVPPDRRQLGVVFQSYAIWPHMTVFENVAYPLRVRRRPAAEIKEKVASALRLVEMEAFADRPSPALSGGQQQRVAIARALAMDPIAMLFDEPTSALDPEMIQEVLDVMVALAKDGMTMIVVTHEMGFARKVAHRVVFMDKGEIIEDAPTADFFGKPRSERAQLFLSKILQH
jgi:iron(III) transport system ATP-binding protein